MVFRLLIQKAARLAKGDPTFTISPHVSTAALLGQGAERLVSLLRGLIRLRRPVFVMRSVRLRCKSKLVIGRGSTLEGYVSIDAESVDGCVLGSNVRIGRFSTVRCSGTISNLGRGVRIGDNSGIGEYSYIGGSGGVVIGRDVIMGQKVSFHPENHVYGDVDVPIRDQGVTRKGIAVGDGCWIGAGAVILDGVTVGEGSVVAAGSVVNRDVPPYSVVGGVPARLIKTRREGVRSAV